MPDLVSLGTIVRPHGVRGELVVDASATAAADLDEVETIYLGEPAQPHTLTRQRWHRGRLLIQLAGVDDRAAAEAYRGLAVWIERTELPALPPGVYYQRQILGLTVVTEAGETLGSIVEIIETGANDVYVVRGPGGDLLIPAAPGVVQKVDLAAGRLSVQLPAGLR